MVRLDKAQGDGYAANGAGELLAQPFRGSAQLAGDVGPFTTLFS